MARTLPFSGAVNTTGAGTEERQGWSDESEPTNSNGCNDDAGAGRCGSGADVRCARSRVRRVWLLGRIRLWLRLPLLDPRRRLVAGTWRFDGFARRGELLQLARRDQFSRRL